MVDDTNPDALGDEVGDDVQWYVDPDGTEWFAEDGVRFEHAEDGFAYPVVGGTIDPAGATPLDIILEDASGDEHDTDGGAEADAEWPETAPQIDPTLTQRIVRVTVDEPLPEVPAGLVTPATAAASSLGDEAENVLDVTEDVSEAEFVIVADDVDDTPTVVVEDRPAAPIARTDSGRVDAEPLLSIEALDAGYGSQPVLKGVDLDIRPGETAVLLGLNGAGKTTTAWTVAGALAPWGGKIMYDGTDVGGWNTGKAVRAGVVMVPEGRRVFPDLSVGRNMQVGAWGKRSDSEWVDAQRERVFNYFPRLREREQQLAGTLSGGEQQMLAVGRGLMAGPRLLIIDEASMGLAPVIVKDVFDIISQINKDGVTVLLIEQNVGALEVADVGYVMEQGRVVRTLVGADLRDRAVVSEALMG